MESEASSCADCHASGVEALATFAENVEIVAKGKGSMPGFQQLLSQQEMEAVAGYVIDKSESGW